MVLESMSSLRQRGDRRRFWRGAMKMHLVFAGCQHIWLYLHQSDTSLKLFCNVTSISCTVSGLRQEMHCKKTESFLLLLLLLLLLFCFVLYVQWQIISKYAKSRGPKILPCGTPDCMVPTAYNLPFAQTYCDLFDRYDWKKGMTEELFK